MILGVILIGLGSAVAIGNWCAVIVSTRTERYVSMVPLVGGALLVFGIHTMTGSTGWALAGLILDPGTSGLVVGLPWLIREIWSTSRFARLQHFHGRDFDREITVELFRRNLAAILIRFDAPGVMAPPYEHAVSIGFSGCWSSRQDGFEIFDFADGRHVTLTASNGCYLIREPETGDNCDPAIMLDGVRLTRRD